MTKQEIDYLLECKSIIISALNNAAEPKIFLNTVAKLKLSTADKNYEN